MDYLYLSVYVPRFDKDAQDEAEKEKKKDKEKAKKERAEGVRAEPLCSTLRARCMVSELWVFCVFTVRIAAGEGGGGGGQEPQEEEIGGQRRGAEEEGGGYKRTGSTGS